MVALVDSLAVVLVLIVAAVVALGVRAAAVRAGLGSTANRLGAGTMLAIAALLGLEAVLAVSGVFSDFDARPPPLMVLVVGVIGAFVVATRTATFRRLLDVMPLAWPTALQSMRVPIELGLWSLCVAGRLPRHLTFEGRNFDVLVGLTAPIVALGLVRGRIGLRGAAVWNVLSLGLLANIVVMAVTSIPGPLHLPWPGPPNTVVAEMPFVWLPGFLVPLALFGHVIALRIVGRASHSERSRATVAAR